jgi:hypothetical protein
MASMPLFSAENSKNIVPRKIIGLYDSAYQPHLHFLNLHQFAEMPLNFLGFDLHYHDLQTGLPNIREDPDIAGVLSFLPNSVNAPDPEVYIQWGLEVMAAGKKFVVMGHPGFDKNDESLPTEQTNVFWNKLGLSNKGQYVLGTIDIEMLDMNYEMMEFERSYEGSQLTYEVKEVISNEITVHASAQKRGDPATRSPVVTTGPMGGYIAENYAIYKPIPSTEVSKVRKWYVNPFEFFREVYDQKNSPKPDVTTLAGRRIYYSQVDGDGWNDPTELEKYRDQKISCAETLYKEILSRYPDLPVTIAPIAADISEEWVGTEASRKTLKSIFELPYVEIGCHTFSHPYEWAFFENYTPKKEAPYLSKYPDGTWEQSKTGGILSRLGEIKPKAKGTDYDKTFGNNEEAFHYPLLPSSEGSLSPVYTIPREYAIKPFNLDREVSGAIKEIELGQSFKTVQLYQWSGDALPFESVISLVRSSGIRNLNGGGFRFDASANSYGWVKPIGRRVGAQQQIYASNANENAYTEFWTKNFYGLNLLPATFKNTDTPLRIKPMNLYYHIYSAEKLPGLIAIKQNLAYINSQEMIPLFASRYAAIAEGFYSTTIFSAGRKRWAIKERGELQTIRFDRHSSEGVDFARSKGVVGQRHLQGSLYVYLDEADNAPIIALKELPFLFEEPDESAPYLIQGRWRVWNVQRTGKESFSMTVQGFGKGDMLWKVPTAGLYKVTVKFRNKKYAAEFQSKGTSLPITVDIPAFQPLDIKVEKRNDT